jgi:hypothetical protein
MKRLAIALESLPTNADMVAKYGVCVQTLHSAARKKYAKAHPLRPLANVPRETIPKAGQ